MKSNLKIELILKLLFIFVILIVIPKTSKTVNLITGNAELSDEKLKIEIKSLVDEIYSKDKNFLEGINRIVVSKEDLNFDQNATFCEGKIIGAYFNDTIIVKDSGDLTNRKTIYHEIGHNVFAKIDTNKKEKWKKLHENSKNFVSIYASVNYAEDFAESFSCYITNFDNCISKLDSSKFDFIQNVTTLAAN